MHLSAPVWHWLESLPGFIGLEAQTLTVESQLSITVGDTRVHM